MWIAVTFTVTWSRQHLETPERAYEAHGVNTAHGVAKTNRTCYGCKRLRSICISLFPVQPSASPLQRAAQHTIVQRRLQPMLASDARVCHTILPQKRSTNDSAVSVVCGRPQVMHKAQQQCDSGTAQCFSWQCGQQAQLPVDPGLDGPSGPFEASRQASSQWLFLTQQVCRHQQVSRHQPIRPLANTP
jgi:hypothetical protein